MAAHSGPSAGIFLAPIFCGASAHQHSPHKHAALAAAGGYHVEQWHSSRIVPSPLWHDFRKRAGLS
jgi:hypothetical protein